MQQSMLEITKDNQSTTLFIGSGKDHFWRIQSPVSWWPGGTEGSWVRRRGATKFRQFSMLELLDSSKKPVARLKEQPYDQGERFQGTLVETLWIFQTDGQPFDVQVKSCPPAKKRFQLWETWAGSLSYVVGQVELIGFEIRDLVTDMSALYVYRGTGISFGPPIKGLPNTIPGVSTKGPANDFEAPGWLLADDFEGDATMQSGNVGLGTSISKNCFDFAGHVDDFPGFLARIPDLQTGRTIGLPSAGFSSGSMKVFRKAMPYRP